MQFGASSEECSVYNDFPGIGVSFLAILGHFWDFKSWKSIDSVDVYRIGYRSEVVGFDENDWSIEFGNRNFRITV